MYIIIKEVKNWALIYSGGSFQNQDCFIYFYFWNHLSVFMFITFSQIFLSGFPISIFPDYYSPVHVN